jgi:hypothetical protein
MNLFNEIFSVICTAVDVSKIPLPNTDRLGRKNRDRKEQLSWLRVCNILRKANK